MKWNELAPLPVYRIPHTAVLLGGVIYVGGGDEGRNFKECQSCYRLDAYSLATNQWSSSPIITPYRYFAMTTLDDKLVTAGGLSKSNEPVRKVLVLKPGQWKDYSDMPTARYDATAVGYHSMLIVVGGGIKVKGKWIQTPITELLDTTTGHWYTCNNLPLPCQQMKAAIMNDKLYLLGGVEESMSSSQMFVASLDTLSNHQVSWQSAPNTPWICPAPVVLYERFLLAVGGIRRFGCASEMCVFYASIGQWKQLTNIPEERSYPVAVGVADNTIIMIGGANDDNKFTNTM